MTITEILDNAADFNPRCYTRKAMSRFAKTQDNKSNHPACDCVECLRYERNSRFRVVSLNRAGYLDPRMGDGPSEKILSFFTSERGFTRIA